MEQKGLKVKRIDKGSTLDPVTVENIALAKANLTVERVDAATEGEIRASRMASRRRSNRSNVSRSSSRGNRRRWLSSWIASDTPYSSPVRTSLLHHMAAAEAI